MARMSSEILREVSKGESSIMREVMRLRASWKVVGFRGGLEVVIRLVGGDE